MKKIALLLALVMMLTALAACGGSAESSAPASESATESEAAPEETSAEAASDDSAADYIEVPVTIQNNTGVEIAELYASGAGVETWGDNLISEGTLPDGSTIDTVFYVDANNLQWDLMMVDGSGNQVELYGLDFTNCSTNGGNIVLEYDSAAGQGTATLYSK